MTVDAYDSAGPKVGTRTYGFWPPKPNVVPTPLGYSRMTNGTLVKAK